MTPAKEWASACGALCQGTRRCTIFVTQRHESNHPGMRVGVDFHPASQGADAPAPACRRQPPERRGTDPRTEIRPSDGRRRLRWRAGNAGTGRHTADADRQAAAATASRFAATAREHAALPAAARRLGYRTPGGAAARPCFVATSSPLIPALRYPLLTKAGKEHTQGTRSVQARPTRSAGTTPRSRAAIRALHPPGMRLCRARHTRKASGAPLSDLRYGICATLQDNLP